jgi:hypothetical protein
MGNVVNLCGSLMDINSELGREIVIDFARFSEGLMDESAIRKKYRFGDDVWASLGSDDALVEAVEMEKVRRIRDGSSKRERAQQLVVQAPNILGTIMNDPAANPRHRIDSAKALDDFAANGPERAPASDRFEITINLGADHVERYSKSIEINANDIDPCNDTDTPPQGLLAGITAKKSQGGGNGEPV